LRPRPAAARALDVAAGLVLAGILAALIRPWARPEDLVVALVLVVGLRLLLRPPPVPVFEPRRMVAMGTVAYALAFSFVTVTRHYTFLTHALDLGYYVQLVWNLAGGRGPRVSLPEMHAWGDHLSPIMYGLVPAFWVAPGAVTLLIFQSAALAAGAPAVFLLARRRLGDARLAALFALLYLTNPSLHGMNVRDFHAAALAVPLLLWAFVAAETRRAVLFAGLIVLTLGTREDAALAVIGVGIWLALGQGRWRAGAVTAAGAFALLYVELRWIIPAFRGEPYSHLARYAGLGRSLTEVLAGIILHPVGALLRVATVSRLVYLLAMLAPLGFLPLLGPGALAGALPALAQNLLSSDPVLFHPRTPYQAFVLPFLVLAAITGYARLRASRSGTPARAALALAVMASLVLSSRTVNQFAIYRWWPDAGDRAAYRVLARVPAEAAVSAQDPYVPHLALRSRVFVFPVGIEASDHLLLNLDSYPWRNLPGVGMARAGDTVEIVTESGGPVYRYAVAAEDGPHLLLRRR
jgi:uncharacterized membrane protein